MGNSACYVIFIDTTQKPPKIRGAGIYSEASPTSELRKAFPVCLQEVEGSSYEDAMKNMDNLLAQPPFQWMKDLLAATPEKPRTGAGSVFPVFGSSPEPLDL